MRERFSTDYGSFKIDCDCFRGEVENIVQQGMPLVYPCQC